MGRTVEAISSGCSPMLQIFGLLSNGRPRLSTGIRAERGEKRSCRGEPHALVLNSRRDSAMVENPPAVGTGGDMDFVRRISPSSGAGRAVMSPPCGRPSSGRIVVLFEREPVGGTCMNWGCIPTKHLLHQTKVLRELRTSKTLERPGWRGRPELAAGPRGEAQGRRSARPRRRVPAPDGTGSSW